MPDERIVKALLQYEVDRGSTAKVAASVDQIVRNFQVLDKHIGKTTETTKDFADLLELLKRSSAVDDLIREFALLGKETGDLDGALDQLRRGLRDVGVDSAGIDRATARFNNLRKEIEKTNAVQKGLTLGRAETLLSQGGRALSGLGATGPGQAVSGVADVLQLLESTKQGLTALAPAAAAAGTATTAASTGIAAMAAGLVPLLPILIPLGAALAVLAIAAKSVSDEIAKGRHAIELALAGMDAFYEALRTGTIDSVNAQIVETTVRKELAAAQLKNLELSSAQAKLDTFKSLGPQALGLGLVFGAFKEIDDKIATLKASTELYSSTLDGLKNVIPELVKKEQDQAQATALLGNAYGKLQKGLSNFLTNIKLLGVDVEKRNQGIISGAAQLAQLSQGDSTKALQSQREILQAQLSAAQGILNSPELSKYLSAEELKQSLDQIAQFRESLRLLDLAEPAVKLRELAAEQKKHDDQAIEAVRSFNSAVDRANEEKEKKELEIKARYAELIADALENEIEAVNQAFDNLIRQQADALLEAGRDESKVVRKEAEQDLELQIKARRAERDDLKEHLRRVRQIQNAAKSEERDALLDRNFLALFKLQESKKEQLTEEEQAYAEQKEDRAQALAEEASDLQRARLFEKSERQIALSERLAVLQTGYQREIAQAALARDRAIAIAQQQRDAALSAAQQQRDGTITAARTQRDAVIALANQTADQVIAANERILRQAYAAGYNYGMTDAVRNGTRATGSGIARYANGGMVAAGHPFLYNDGRPGQRESLNGVELPHGLGVAIPYQSGRVDPGSGGGMTLQQYITVQGSDNPELTARAVVRISREQAVKVVREVVG